MTDTSRKATLSIKLPQINRLIGGQQSHTERKERNLSTNPYNKMAVSQIPDKLSKRYELEKELRRKEQSAVKPLMSNKPPVVSLRSQVAIEAKKHLKHLSSGEAVMRESKMLLFKNMEHSKKRKNLGYLLDYKPDEEREPIIINRYKRTPKVAPLVAKSTLQRPSVPCKYQRPQKLQELDFLKLFILEQLVYYLSQSNNRSKQEMLGFCRIYLQNSDKLNSMLMPLIFQRQDDVEKALLLQKLGLYVILLLSTDSVVSKDILSQLKSLCTYMHSSNLITLDVSDFLMQVLMLMVEYEQASVATQFHVFNTLRFNEQRRKIVYENDAVDILAKNNAMIEDLLKEIVKNCTFQSLRNFVVEILDSKAGFEDKYEEVMFVLMSLEQIMSTSIKVEETAKPEPPFLPASTKPYTLVLDLDETLIHYREVDSNQSFLVRPYCHEFLQELSQYYELVIFTASVKQYADTILDIIDKPGHITHRLYRQHTRLEEYVSIKDLSLLGRDLSKTIIVDNIPSNFKLQPRNGIYITTWTGEEGDCCLLNLMPVLQLLVKKDVPDVRVGLEEISKYMERQLQNSQQVDLDEVRFS